MADYEAEYRDCQKFIEFCKVCKNYGTLWSCPPFEPDSEIDISKYKFAYILGTKVFIDERTRYSADSVEARTRLTYDILLDVRKEIDQKLLDLEKRFAGSLAFYAGSCRQCEDNICTRSQSLACTKPERMRSSLEAIGFDMGKTTSTLLGIEMKWSTDNVLPEYFTLVSALLTNHTSEDIRL